MVLFAGIKNRWAGYKADYSGFHKIGKYALAMATLSASSIYAGYVAATASGATVTFSTTTALASLTTGSAIVTTTGGTGVLATIGTFAISGGFLLGCAAVATTCVACLSLLRGLGKNAKTQTIQNKAGQSVEGPTWAINRLQKAQQQVTQLTTSFNTASALPEETAAAVQKIVTDPVLEKAQKAIKVTHAQQGATTDTRYHFVREIHSLQQVG